MMRRRCFLFTAASLAAQPGSRAGVLVKGKLASTLYADAEFDKPFLYPIRTPAGKILSRGFPLSRTEGESTDHGWHRGFFYGHGSINGHDFWRELGRDKTSRLVTAPESIASTDGNLQFNSAMTIPTGESIGNISQRYRFQEEGSLYAMETEITISASEGRPLSFGDTDDGGFAFRLSDAFREDRGATLLNSEGQSGTANIWGRPARWVHYQADLAAGAAGVAVLDHPSNLRHPSRWHARGYSLCAANPFALRSFTKDKTLDGAFTLATGRSLTLRYLVLIHDGALSASDIESRYRRFGA